MPSLAIVIPARMGSTRFPGKPLCDLLGKPMVQWVVEACQEADVTDQIYVATPDQEIVDACESFGAKAILTGHHHITGTDRIGEVAQKVAADAYINVQGDEPLIHPITVRAAAGPLVNDPSVQLTSVYNFCTEEEFDNPAVVKVVTDANNDAVYFSRYAIPFARNPRVEKVKKHVGIYGYRREPLLAFSGWAMPPSEVAESLEQLRFLHNGYRMRMAEGPGTDLAVDTPEQAEQVRQILMSRA